MITKTNVQSTATLVSAARARNWFILQNQSDVDIFVAFTSDGGSVTGSTGAKPGILISAGEEIGMGQLPGGAGERFATNLAIYAIHESTGDKVLVCHEG